MKNVISFFKGLLFLSLLYFTLVDVRASDSDSFIEKSAKNIEAAYFQHPDKGLSLSEELLKYGIDNKDEKAIAEAYFQLGQGNFHKGRIRLSNEYFKKALRTDYAQENIGLQARCLRGQGTNYDFLGDESMALSTYQNALKLFEQIKDSHGIALTWNNMGMLDFKLSQFSESEYLLKKALDYFERAKDIPNTNGITQNLSLLYAKQMKYDDALYYMYQILSRYKLQRNKVGEIHMLMNIAHVNADMGNAEKAISFFEKALSEARKINADDIIANAYLQLANLKGAQPEEKLKYLQQAKSLHLKNGNYLKLEEIYYIQMDYFARSGDIKNYESTLKEFREIQGELAQNRHAEKYEEQKAIYELEKKEELIEEQLSKIKLKNQLLWSSGGLISLLILALIIFYNMYVKIREYARSLYKINIDLQTAGVLQISFDKNNHLSDPEESDNNAAIDESGFSGIDKLKELYEDIIRVFENEKLYKQNDLSVADVSKYLNTNDKYVSQAINTYGNGNFTSLVNAYRIHEARNLIEEFGKDITIKELADRAGFNSLNTFYKKFKEATGLTPSMYIEIAVQENELAKSG